MEIFLIAACVFAALESLALWKGWTRLETIAKPAVMIFLFLGLWFHSGLNGVVLWFGLGIVFSLAGDVFLMISLDRLFLMGLMAFLIAHICYVIGFNTPPPEVTAWSLILAVMIGLGGARLIRRIIAPLAAQGRAHLRTPILVYSVVISVMLLSAVLKLTDRTWNAAAAVLVSLGALLFYASDILLAWNKYVSPIKHGRLVNIAAYHLGQIALIAGVMMKYPGRM
jgi:uncharacterized membrane protein YhhN